MIFYAFYYTVSLVPSDQSSQSGSRFSYSGMLSLFSEEGFDDLSADFAFKALFGCWNADFMGESHFKAAYSNCSFPGE